LLKPEIEPDIFNRRTICEAYVVAQVK